jgi:hypothetical protein
MILVDLRLRLLISYNAARSLEGYEALGVVRAEVNT